MLERGVICGGASGFTTAKVSALQETRYTEIAKMHGDDAGAAYAAASLAAVARIDELVREERIDCGWERVAAYTYAADDSQVDTRSIDDIPVGEARVVRSGLGKIGVYRDHDNVARAVSLRCTHLGCLLAFTRPSTAGTAPATAPGSTSTARSSPGPPSSRSSAATPRDANGPPWPLVAHR